MTRDRDPQPDPPEITGFDAENSYVGFARQVKSLRSGSVRWYWHVTRRLGYEFHVVPSASRARMKLASWGAERFEDNGVAANVSEKRGFADRLAESGLKLAESA